MNILIDMSSAQPHGTIAINGGGEYSRVLLEQLCEYEKEHHKVEIILNSKLGKNTSLNSFAELHNLKIIEFSDINHFSQILKNNKYDILVLPICYYIYGELVVPDTIKIVSAVHDLCDIFFDRGLRVCYGKYPKLDRLNGIRKIKDCIVSKKNSKKHLRLYNKIFSLNNNQIMYTVSEYTKNTISYYLEVIDDDIPVFYPPDLHATVVVEDEEETLVKYNVDAKKFVLLSAGSRWAKNNAIVLITLDRMFSKYKYEKMLDGFKVVLLGVDDVNRAYFASIIKNKDRFVFEGYISSEKLEVLYKNAFAFVFPSVLEGFGQPPVEAMKYGTTVACSTAMSIPEVCGDAAIYFDPYDINSIELSIVKCFDRRYVDKLKEREIERYNQLKYRRENDLISLLNEIMDTNIKRI